MKEAIKNCKTFNSGDEYAWYIQTYWWDKNTKSIKKINFCSTWCPKFTKNNNIKIKPEADGKINLFSCCIDCGFKKFKLYEKQ